MSAPQSKEEFKARVRDWARKLDVEVQVISLRAMKRKWASYTERSSGELHKTLVPRPSGPCTRAKLGVHQHPSSVAGATG